MAFGTSDLINIVSGILLVVTGIVLFYEVMLYMELRKYNEHKTKIMVVIILTSILALMLLLFGIWHFFLY